MIPRYRPLAAYSLLLVLSPPAAAAFCERLRGAIERHEWGQLHPRLHRAKRAGRNRVA